MANAKWDGPPWFGKVQRVSSGWLIMYRNQNEEICQIY